MPNLQRMRDEHDRLLVVAGHLTKLIASDVPPPPAKLYAVRMALASQLLHHLKTEDWVLYPRLLASEDERVATTARAFATELGGLADRFRDHSNRWSAAAIEHDWQGYRREASKLLICLRQRIIRENDELYPLFETARDRAA